MMVGGCGDRALLRWCGVLGVVVSMGVVRVEAQTAQFDAVGLVRRAVQHRLAEDKSHRPMRYVLRKTDGRRETVKVIVETKDGDVARLIEVDGRPLSAEADRVELDRLQNLAEHPELQEHRHRSEVKDEVRVDRLMGMLPDAEIYTFEGMVACDAGQCYKLSFAPNPKFEPPDMEADVLKGAAGEVLIDKEQERLVRLNARFVADVDFGFGILAKVNKGGTAELRQTDVGGHEWELTGLKVRMTGRALLVKSLDIELDEETSGYTPVAAGMGYREAIDMLKKPETLKK
jgi:hypothetical protein